jgi:spermidine synthase
MRPGIPRIVHSQYLDDLLVRVVDMDGERSLFFGDGILQSRLSLAAPDRLQLFYTQYMMSALLMLPEPGKVLLIGVGAGSLVHFLHHHFPDCAVDAVDHLPGIIRIAIDYFQMPVRKPIAIHCSDGYEFLARQRMRPAYDLILLDAFDDKGMSKAVYGADFFRLCMESLRPNGILSCNLWTGNREELVQVQNDIRQHSISRIYIPVHNRGNIVALAFNKPVPWREINCSKAKLNHLSQRFHLDLTRIVDAAIRHNLTFTQRIGLFFR